MPDNRLSVIDLKATPPKVIATLETGASPAGLLKIEGAKVEYTKRDLYAGLRPYGPDIASTGAVAAVANIGRGNGDNDTISLIDLQAKPPRVVDTVTVGQTPEGITMSPDGSTILVGNMVEKNVQVFEFSGASLSDTGAKIAVKGGSAAIRTAEK